jgi:hypothetical protein
VHSSGCMSHTGHERVSGGAEQCRCSGSSPSALSCAGIEGAVLAGMLDSVAVGGDVEICRAAGCLPQTDGLMFCSPLSCAVVPEHLMHPHRDLDNPLVCVSTQACSRSIPFSHSTTSLQMLVSEICPMGWCEVHTAWPAPSVTLRWAL